MRHICNTIYKWPFWVLWDVLEFKGWCRSYFSKLAIPICCAGMDSFKDNIARIKSLPARSEHLKKVSQCTPHIVYWTIWYPMVRIPWNYGDLKLHPQFSCLRSQAHQAYQMTISVLNKYLRCIIEPTLRLSFNPSLNYQGSDTLWL